jgi:hypothetical protein
MHRDVPSAAPTEPVETALKGIDELQQRTVRERNNLLLLEHNREAQKNAIEAFELYPDDREAFSREYRERMGQIPVPLGLRSSMMQIQQNAEMHYYRTIFNGEFRARRKKTAETAGQLASMQYNRGLLGLENSNDFQEIHRDFLNSAAALDGVDEDGLPYYGEEQRREIFSGWDGHVLTAAIRRGINSGMSDGDIGQILEEMDGKGDVSVALGPEGMELEVNGRTVYGVGKPGESVIRFSGSELREELRRKIKGEAIAAIADKIEGDRAQARVALATGLLDGSVDFLPGNAAQMAALNYQAQLQVAANPIDGDTLRAHLTNARQYVENFGILPDAYAGTLGKMVRSQDPIVCANGARVLEELRAVNGPAVVAAMDAVTSMRAQMLWAQVESGTPPDAAIGFIERTMREFTRDPKEFERRLNEAKESFKETRKGGFYGNKITAENGYDVRAREKYERLVDGFFSTNGGDRDSAVSVAQDVMAKNYAFTGIGYHGKKRVRMENSPESVYGPAVTAIANRDLENLGRTITEMTGIPFALDHLVLIATPATDWAVQNGENPAWEIWRREDDGSALPYKSLDGKTLYYRVPPGTEEKMVGRALQKELRRQIYGSWIGAAKKGVRWASEKFSEEWRMLRSMDRENWPGAIAEKVVKKPSRKVLGGLRKSIEWLREVEEKNGNELLTDPIAVDVEVPRNATKKMRELASQRERAKRAEEKKGERR